MQIFDTLLGSAFKLFFGVFSMPLFIVVVIDLVSTGKRMIGGA